MFVCKQNKEIYWNYSCEYVCLFLSSPLSLSVSLYLCRTYALCLSRANVNGKDISLYSKAKEKHTTSSSMKKADFKAAIDQIELALRGQDSAPNSYEVLIPFDLFGNSSKSSFFSIVFFSLNV